MKIQIRESVFETNSSSSHSVVVSNKDRGHDYNLPVDEEGFLHIPYGEFGWGPEILRTPMEKLSYIITDRGGLDPDVVKAIITTCPQVKDVVADSLDDYYEHGYVDHQSIGTSREDIPLEKFIFDNGVIIVIDNDNSCHFEAYKPGYNWETREKTPAPISPENLFDKPLSKVLADGKDYDGYHW